MAQMESKPTSDILHRPFFLWSLPFSFLYFGLPVVSKGFGATAFEIGGLFSVFTATTLILRPAIGWALDRSSPKRFLVTAFVIYAAAMGVFAFAGSLTWLYAGRIIQGIGSAMLWTTTYTIIANLTGPEARGRALGRLNEITTQGGLAGIFAAFILMAVLPKDMAWKVAFIGFAALTLLGAALTTRGLPSLRNEPEPSGSASPITSRLARLLVIVFITGVPEAMLSPIYLTYLQDKFTTSMESLALAFFPAALVAAFFSARLGALSDRFGRVPMMAAGLAGAGALSFWMPGMNSLLWVAAFFAGISVMGAISEPAETALIADLTGQQRRGLAYGIYDFVENLGFVIGPVLGGLVYDSVSRAAPFYINGAMLIVGAGLAVLLLGRRIPKQPETVTK